MEIISAKPRIVVKNGKPHAVVLAIKEYERLLELAEDKEDLAELRRIKKGGPSFSPLRDYAGNHV